MEPAPLREYLVLIFLKVEIHNKEILNLKWSFLIPSFVRKWLLSFDWLFFNLF